MVRKQGRLCISAFKESSAAPTPLHLCTPQKLWGKGIRVAAGRTLRAAPPSSGCMGTCTPSPTPLRTPSAPPHPSSNLIRVSKHLHHLPGHLPSRPYSAPHSLCPFPTQLNPYQGTQASAPRHRLRPPLPLLHPQSLCPFPPQPNPPRKLDCLCHLPLPPLVPLPCSATHFLFPLLPQLNPHQGI